MTSNDIALSIALLYDKKCIWVGTIIAVSLFSDLFKTSFVNRLRRKLARFNPNISYYKVHQALMPETSNFKEV